MFLLLICLLVTLAQLNSNFHDLLISKPNPNLQVYSSCGWRLGYNMTESHRERRVHPRKSLGTRLFNSVLYKPRCKNSMHKWLHWRCPLLTESFACHSSPGMTLVLGTLIPFVISVFFICPCMATSISDHHVIAVTPSCMYTVHSLRLAPQCPAFAKPAKGSIYVARFNSILYSHCFRLLFLSYCLLAIVISKGYTITDVFIP